MTGLTALAIALANMPDFECEDCIGMRNYGCYCASMGAIRPGGPAANSTEAKHFFVCPDCGQAVDMRDLRAVLHHEQAGHDRLPEAA